jgi:hypothetical protein
MSDDFLVDHICITCDRIAELKLAIFSNICNVSKWFCYRTTVHFRDSMMYSGLFDGFQPTKHAMLGCSILASLQSDLLYLLCLFHTSLPKCDTDPYFTYICNFSCILSNIHILCVHVVLFSTIFSLPKAEDGFS